MCDVPPKDDVQSLCLLVLAKELCATLQGQVAVRSVQRCRSQSRGLPLHPIPLQQGKQDALDLYWIMYMTEP